MKSELMATRAGRALGWRTTLGLLLVPLTAAGVLLWGLWSPTDRLDTVTAAVVNLDEPVTVDGQMVPLGRVLAAELIAGDADTNYTWLLTDESDGAAGLDDGRYATVVTIPENFSSAATSMSRGADEAETATIDIATSDRGRLLDAALSNIVTSTATSVLNQQLGAQFVGGVFVGMTELGKGIGEAADGARLLADGSLALADGTAELAGGATQLADGTAQLSSGTGELATGAAGLAQGADALANGAGGLASGAGDLAAGAAGLSAGADELAAGARDAAAGGAQLADGVEQYTGMVNQVVTGVIDSTGAVLPYVRQVRELFLLIPAELWPADAELTHAQALEALDALVAELEAASGDGDGSMLWQLRQAGEDLSAGVRASADGQAQLAEGLTDFAGGLGQYAAGVGQFSSGASQLAGGVSDLAGGASQLAGGALQLADGAPALAAGASELAAGTVQLADGARQAADGTVELADGLRTAALEIPSYTDAQAERMAEVAVQPVSASGADDELFNAAGVPLFAGIALWAGALASFLVLSPLWRRTQEAARGVGFVALRSALPAALLGAAQGALVGLLLPPLLGYTASEWAGFFGLALVAGVAFSLVAQGLSALLGGFGRFVAFALLVVAFAIGVISTAPPVLQAIGDASPVGALFAGFQAVAMGTSGAGTAAFLLVVWGLGGLALTAFAVARARRSVGVQA